MSKRQEKRLRQIQDERMAKALRDLGWEEVEDWSDSMYRWRCKICKAYMFTIDCSDCGRCEGCYECKPR